ncbi:hypothetical protein KDN32_19255 [Nocardioides sp. J2M5]|uniref:hypothetical protein n=1 Tax=Nocardioides palaemonis TaxID=2829810 RepID=UPI001BAAD506|nr:hypothetical protein [Nocardioides palaemonis]MBS2939884.1 hypothetical protein [Nocardioides palaemonis]
MTAQLREELDALADTHSFSPDPAAWDRGRRARRRGRVVAVAAVLVLVASVGGLAAAWTAREPVAPAGRVDGGAIPSRIGEPTGGTVTDLAFGPASVAYVDSDDLPVLVSATTGEARHVELPDFPEPEAFEIAADYRRGPWLALSPDGTRVAYPTVTRFEREPGQDSFTTGWYRVVDLTTGTSDLVDLPPSTGTPLTMSWSADGRIAVDVPGRPTLRNKHPDVAAWTIDPATSEATRTPAGLVSPDGRITAPVSQWLETVDAVPFVTASGDEVSRPIPADAFPTGAPVLPVGWVDDDTLAAQVGSDLVLLTSPDRPESDWVWRPLAESDRFGLSVAVDLVPDLTGDPDQELTHDFAAAPAADGGPGRGPVVAGGVLALLAGLAFVRMMRRRA